MSIVTRGLGSGGGLITQGLGVTNEELGGLEAYILESIAVTDTVDSYVDRVASITEPLSVDDDSSVVLEAYASISEAFDPADAISAALDAYAAISEAFTPDDSSTVALVASASVTEELDPTDSITAARVMSGVVNETLFQALPPEYLLLSDVPSANAVFYAEVTEVLSLADNNTSVRDLFADITEGCNPDDSTTYGNVVNVEVIEYLDLEDFSDTDFVSEPIVAPGASPWTVLPPQFVPRREREVVDRYVYFNITFNKYQYKKQYSVNDDRLTATLNARPKVTSLEKPEPVFAISNFSTEQIVATAPVTEAKIGKITAIAPPVPTFRHVSLQQMFPTFELTDMVTEAQEPANEFKIEIKSEGDPDITISDLSVTEVG